MIVKGNDIVFAAVSLDLLDYLIVDFLRVAVGLSILNDNFIELRV